MENGKFFSSKHPKYKEVINYLYTSLPIFQDQGEKAYKPGLERTIKLLEILGNPHHKFKSVHIAGTNGKGSVSHSLASVLQVAGYKTGLYTSPHLLDYRERIRINGVKIKKKYVILFVKKILPMSEKIKPTFFEITVAMAFYYFAKKKVDIAVIETGMGGRLDSTNVITPIISIITNIGRDHMQYLGDTPEKIAYEKAGIIKPNVPVIIGESQHDTKEIFISRSKEMDAPICFADMYFAVKKVKQQLKGQVLKVKQDGKTIYKKLSTDLNGAYQHKNIVTALMAIETLKCKGIKFTRKEISKGFAGVKKRTGLYGRWDLISKRPVIILDNAHNKDGFDQLTEQLKELKYNKLYIVFGTVKDKKPEEVMPVLPANAYYFFCKAPQERAKDDKELLLAAQQCGLKGINCGNVLQALHSALGMANKKDLLLVTGSTFIVAEAMKYYKK